MLNMFSGFGSEILMYFLTFATRTVFIQTLGRDYLGIGGLFTNILTMLGLAELGVREAMNFRFYKPLKENDQDKLIALMAFYKKVYRIIGFVILGLGLAVIPFMGVLIKDIAKYEQLGVNLTVVYLLYLLQCVTGYWFYAYKTTIIKAAQKEYYINLSLYVGVLVTNVAQIVILLCFEDYLLYVSIVIFLNILQNLANAVIADKMFPFLRQKPKYLLSKAEKRDIFKDCGAISLFSISTVVLKATDNLVLSAFIGLEIVGLYSNYLMVYNALKKIIKKIFRSAEASIGNLFANAKNSVKQTYFLFSNYIMVLLGGTISVCVVILSDPFIRQWVGDSFVIPMPFALLMGVELYVISMKLVLEQMRNVMGLFRQVKWRPVLAVVLNVALSVWLVNVCGIYGVLIGTVVSELLTVFVIDPVIIYKHGFGGEFRVRTYYFKNLLYLLELTVLGVLNFLFTQFVLTGFGWLSLILHAAVCFFSTGGVLVLLNRGTEEGRMFAGLVKNILKKFRKRKKKTG